MPQVADLKKELKDRGITLPASAKKSDLVAKLSEVLGMVTENSAALVPDDSGSGDLLSQTLAAYAGDQITSPSSVNATLGSTLSSITSPSLSSGSPTKTTPSVQAPTLEPGNKSPVKAVVVPVADPVAALTARAARFGGSVSSVAKSVEELDALKKRADRFGVSVSPSVATLEEKAKLAQRASRFNIPESEQVKPKKPLGLKRKNVLSSSEESTVSSTKKTTVMSKEEEEKLKKRKERFGSSV